MGNSLLSILLCICFSCNSALRLTITGKRIKPEINFAQHAYHSWENETEDDDTYDILDSCKDTENEDKSTDFEMQSLQSWSYITTTERSTEIVDTSFVSDGFLACPLIEIEPECYQLFQNGSVYVPLYDKYFNQESYIIYQGNLLLCSEILKHWEEKFSRKIDTVSIVGTAISTACIILHTIMFCLVNRMRNFPGYCLLSLCCALLIAYTCSFIQFSLGGEAINCTANGMIIFYSMLSSFFWLNVISYDVWMSIRLSTIKLILTANRGVFARFAFYSLYGWGTPLLIVVIAIITDHLTTDVKFKLNFRTDTCWFQNKYTAMIYFALPLCIVLLVNILFFISSFYMIAKATISRHDSGSQDNLRSRLFLTLRLFCAMGLMWIFGIIASLTQREWLFYLYSVCNALQGVFIFFSFTLNDKTIKACQKAIQKKKSSILPLTSSREFGHPQYNTQ